MRLSAVDGTAFVDFSAADLLTANIGKRLTVLDSAGKKLIGFIKAAGTGETYGTSKFGANNKDLGIGSGDPFIPTNWGNSSLAAGESHQETVDPYGGTGNSIHINTGTSGRGIYFTSLSTTQYELVKRSFAAKRVSGTIGSWGQNMFPDFTISSGYADWGVFNGYYTAPDTRTNQTFDLRASGAGMEFLLDNPEEVKILTPSATGVTIVSIPGGTVFNWESKEAGFNYNNPAGYEYLITNQRAIFSNHYRQMRAA